MITTHTLLVAEHIADRVGILAEGALLAADTVAKVREQAGVDPEAPLSNVYYQMVGHTLPLAPEVH